MKRRSLKQWPQTFATLVTDQKLRKQVNTIQGFCSAPEPFPLMISGKSGTGKTHLLRAIEHSARNEQRKALYISTEELVKLYLDAIVKEQVHTFVARLLIPDILLVDDVNFLRGKERITATFSALFQLRSCLDKGVIIACTKETGNAELEKLFSAKQIQIEPLDFSTRVLFAKRFCRTLHLNVSASVIRKATRTKNLFELAGLLRTESFKQHHRQ